MGHPSPGVSRWLAATAVCFLTFASFSIRPQQTIRTTSEAVLVDFVVRDGSGRPVTDLGRDEVEVYEEGVLQQLHSFGFSRALRTGDRAATSDPVTTPGSPGVGSQAGAAVADLRFPSLVSIVFDQLSISSRNLAGTACRDFVRQLAGSGTLVSVWVLDHGLRVIQEFTDDPERLEAAVERATSLAEIPYEDLSSQVMDRMEHYMNLRKAERGGQTDALGADAPKLETIDMKAAELILNITRISESGQREQQGRSAFFGLMRLFRGLGEVSGRKSVLFFSEGFQVPIGMEQFYQAAIHEANRNQVSVYTIDARGLQTERPLEQAARAQALAAEMGRLQQTTFTAFFTLEDIKLVETSLDPVFQNAQGLLRGFAESTGGFLTANTNDFRGGLERLAEDLSNHYEAAYLPRNLVYDGSFRRIEVKIRRPGVKVQARNGYFAMPPDPGFPLLPHEARLLQALNESGSAGEVELSARLIRFDRNEEGNRCALVAELPLGELSLQRQGDRFESALSLLALVRDSSGQVVEKYSQRYPMSVPVENLDQVRSSFAVFLQDVRLPDSSYTLEVAVADGGDRLGRLRGELDLTRPRTGLHTSSLVLLREARVREDEGDPEDPLNYRGLRLLPRVGPVPREPGGALPVYVVLYPDANRSEEPTLTLVLSRDGRDLQSVGVRLPEPDERGSIPVLLSLPLDWFQPGSYTLAAEAGQGPSRFSERLDFTVR